MSTRCPALAILEALGRILRARQTVIIITIICSLCSAVTRTLLHEDHLLLNTWLALGLLIIVLKLGIPVSNNIQLVLPYHTFYFEKKNNLAHL